MLKLERTYHVTTFIGKRESKIIFISKILNATFIMFGWKDFKI